MQWRYNNRPSRPLSHLDVDEKAPRGPDGLIKLGRDVPPPGYTDFYGWSDGGVFHGLKGISGALLQRFRQEGRWFDDYGDEYARWDARGRPLNPIFRKRLDSFHCDAWHDKKYEQDVSRSNAKVAWVVFIPHILLALVILVAWIASKS
jgi:hypothetical protein